MSSKPKDHTKTIAKMKSVIGDLQKNINKITKEREKEADKGTEREVTPEDHQAALSHFATQYKMAKLNKDDAGAAAHARAYHDYSHKLSNIYQKRLKEGADLCPLCERDPCECDDSHGFIEEELNDILPPSQRSSAKHRVSVTYSDPHHTMVTKRKEKQNKVLRVPATDKRGNSVYKAEAELLAKKHMKRQGYKVHDVSHVSIVNEAVTVDKEKYSWGKMITVHHGHDYSFPLHPEHQAAIKKLRPGDKTTFKDETGRQIHAHREGDQVHLVHHNTGSSTARKTTVGYHHFDEGKMGEKAAGDLDFHSEIKNDDPPFDKPYKRKPATVTDKSGAKHTALSRVRDLARRSLKKEGYVPDHSGVLNKQDSSAMSKVAALMAKEKAAKAAKKPVKEDVEQVNELNKDTLLSYMRKVSADSQKHKMDPSKRSAAKASKSVSGFAKAFNKHTSTPAVKEEVEQVDELNVMTLSKYASKARSQSMDKDNPKRYKRGSGAAKAYDKINRGDYSESIENPYDIHEIKMSDDEYSKNVSSYGKRATNLLKHSWAQHDVSKEKAKAGDKPGAEKHQAVGSRAHKLFLKAKEKHLSKPENAERHRKQVMSGISDYYKSKKPGEYTGD